MFYGVTGDAYVHSVRHRKADRGIRLQVSRARDPPVLVQALLRGVQACLVFGEPREAHRSRADVARPAFSRKSAPYVAVLGGPSMCRLWGARSGRSALRSS